MIELTIPGKPMGKQRARTGKGFAFTPKETVNYENLVKILYVEKWANKVPSETPMWLEIDAYYQIPKSYSKGKKLAAKHNAIRPTAKPDIDNIAKIIADSLNGIAYKDDSQIVLLKVQKYYTDDNPRVEIRLGETVVE